MTAMPREAEPAPARDMTGGYIKLFRRSISNPVFQGDVRLWSIWAWMLVTAQRDPYEMPTKFGPIRLEPGEVLIAERVIEELFGVSRRAVRELLERLVAEKMLNRKPNRKCKRAGTVYEIEKYLTYQRFEPDFAVHEGGKADHNRTANRTKNNSSTYVEDISADSPTYVGGAGGRAAAPKRGEKKPRRPDAERRGYLGTDDALDGQLAFPEVAELPICSPAPTPKPTPPPEPVPESKPVELAPAGISTPAPTASQPPSAVICITKRRAAKIERDAMFAEWYAAYPKRHDPGDAEKQYFAAIKRGATHAELMAGATRYAAYCQAKGTEREMIKHPGNWLRAGAWSNDYTLPATTIGAPSHGHQSRHNAKPATGGNANAELRHRLNAYRARHP